VLLHSSRAAHALQKEAFVGQVAKFLGKKGLGAAASKATSTAVKKPGMLKSMGKRIGQDFGGLGAARKASKAAPAIGALQKGQARGMLNNWKPKTMVGKASKLVAKNPMKTVGIGAGTYVAGDAVAGGVSKAMQPTDPYALARRRMSGFRRQ
jgi:hypothetical protein